MVIFNTFESIFRFFREVVLFLTPLKYYRNDPIGYIPLPFGSVIHHINADLTKSTNLYWTLACTYGGETRDTQIFLVRPFNTALPSLIFHHPSGETNHSLAYSFILGPAITRHFNVFLIKAQKHSSTGEFLRGCVDTFLHHQLTFAGSVLAAEKITRYHRTHAKTKIVISGASMGGIVAALHAYFFGSADHYFPLAAYPNVGEIFMGTSYRFGIYDWAHKRTNAHYLKSFQLSKPFRKATLRRITPILGRHDRIVLFQKAASFWKHMYIPFHSYPYGHFTPAIVRKEIQRLIITAAK